VCICAGIVPVTQNMASGCEAQTVDSKGDDVTPAFSSDKSCAEDRSSSIQCSNGDISRERKWEFRPPPRGLTPNEYVLCHR